MRTKKVTRADRIPGFKIKKQNVLAVYRKMRRELDVVLKENRDLSVAEYLTVAARNALVQYVSEINFTPNARPNLAIRRKVTKAKRSDVGVNAH